MSILLLCRNIDETSVDFSELIKRLKTDTEIAQKYLCAAAHPMKQWQDERAKRGATTKSTAENFLDQHVGARSVEFEVSSTLYLEAIEEESTINETKVLNVIANLLAKKVDSQRNLFDASTCLVEAVYKNNSVLTQMMTNALLPLVGQSDAFDFSMLFADAIKRGCKSSIVQNINQLMGVGWGGD